MDLRPQARAGDFCLLQKTVNGLRVVGFSDTAEEALAACGGVTPRRGRFDDFVVGRVRRKKTLELAGPLLWDGISSSWAATALKANTPVLTNLLEPGVIEEAISRVYLSSAVD